jgi:hypothetical protein
MPGLVVLDEERASEIVDVELMFGGARNCEGDGVGDSRRFVRDRSSSDVR